MTKKNAVRFDMSWFQKFVYESTKLVPPSFNEDKVWTPVNLVITTVAVNKLSAEQNRERLIEELKKAPLEMLNNVIVSILHCPELHVEQETMLRLFALGSFLGLWVILTPADFGLPASAALASAQSGNVMVSSFRNGSKLMTQTEIVGLLSAGH